MAGQEEEDAKANYALFTCSVNVMKNEDEAATV